MENATDALYLGFAILAFVVALSLSIFSFSEVTNASQSIINARDKTTLYEMIDSSSGETERTVTMEDIIPTLYRAYYENYTVKFEGIDLYQVRVVSKDPITGKETSSYEPTNIIDLENQKIGSHEDADSLIRALLEGGGAFETLIQSSSTRFSYFKGIGLQNPSLYDILKGKSFKEKIGIYYMEDKSSQSSIDDVNKTKKRIITYEEIN